MKTFIVAIILLISISASSFLLSAYSDERIDEIINLTNQIREENELNEKTRLCIDTAMKIWEKNEKLFHITIDRSDMIVVKKEIAGAIGATRGNSNENFLVAAEKLAITLDNIKGYTKLRPENIF